MKPIILFVFSLLLTLKIIAQGGCDIKYIEVDNITIEYKGKQAKIDFVPDKRGLGGRSRTPDTVRKQIFGQSMTIVEHRKKGADYWYYSEQINECLNCDTTKYVVCNATGLLGVTKDKLQFRIYLDFYDKKERKRLLFTKTEDIWFDKKEIEGIFIQL